MKYAVASLSPDKSMRFFDMEDFMSPRAKPVYFPLKWVESWRRFAVKRLKARDDLDGAKAVICLLEET